jgi:hypothetical protein
MSILVILLPRSTALYLVCFDHKPGIDLKMDWHAGPFFFAHYNAATNINYSVH